MHDRAAPSSDMLHMTRRSTVQPMSRYLSSLAAIVSVRCNHVLCSSVVTLAKQAAEKINSLAVHPSYT